MRWDRFCPAHAGISSSQADRLSGQLAEFGAPYFHLTDLVPVWPSIAGPNSEASKSSGKRQPHANEARLLTPFNIANTRDPL